MSEIRLKEIYSWPAAYNAAILETDNAVMPLRIYEALAAVEQRFLSPIELWSAQSFIPGSIGRGEGRMAQATSSSLSELIHSRLATPKKSAA